MSVGLLVYWSVDGVTGASMLKNDHPAGSLECPGSASAYGEGVGCEVRLSLVTVGEALVTLVSVIGVVMFMFVMVLMWFLLLGSSSVTSPVSVGGATSNSTFRAPLASVSKVTGSTYLVYDWCSVWWYGSPHSVGASVSPSVSGGSSAGSCVGGEVSGRGP